jgi:predicted glycoside hydrolase/deacetylase ChbG (UPF0249 family)
MGYPANLLVNADDFGIHPRVSKAIAQAADEGLIHSFSVLPLRKDDAFHRDLLRDIVERHPEVKVGAHLALLSPEEGLGEGPGHFRQFLLRYVTGRFPARRVHDAWDGQVRALGALLGGTGKVAHLDGHQHLHMLPGLWGAAQAIKERYRIPRLRVPFEGFGPNLARRFPFALALQALAWMRLGRDGRRLIGFATSTAFTVEGNARLLDEAARHPDRLYEVMVHPALQGGEGPEEGAPAESQCRELGELRRLKARFESRAPGARP